MHRGRVVALAMALCALFAAAPAAAGQDVRLIGSDARLRVEASGVASVENIMRWRVVRGPLHSIDIANIFPVAVGGPQVTATSEDGRDLATRLIRLDDTSLRVLIEEPHPPTRGAIALNLRWQVDLLLASALVKGDSYWRLSWSAPVAENGFDSAKTVIELPSAAEPPLAILADTGTVDNGADAKLVREPGRDILELVKPHVAGGEAVRWTVRIDPHAFLRSSDSRSVSSDESRAVARGALTAQLFTTVGIGILALAFGLLIDKKTRWFAVACWSHRAAGGAPGLLPLPLGLRGPLAGVALAAGLELQLLGRLTAGTALVAGGALCAALSPPMVPCRARGPARWLVLRAEDAFSSGSRQADRWLGLGAAAGCAILLSLTALLVAISCRLPSASAYRSWVGAMNCVVLIPLLATGRVSQLPPRDTPTTKRWLSSVLRQLKRIDILQVAPWARVTLDGAVDELRLLALPRAAVPGVVGIEVGFAWSGTPVGWVATPQVLVRFLEDSCAAVILGVALPSARAVPGRRAEEKVMLLTPQAPASSVTVALARMLTQALAERRATGRNEWGGPERRAAQEAIAV
jgi:hypothetical protein